MVGEVGCGNRDFTSEKKNSVGLLVTLFVFTFKLLLISQKSSFAFGWVLTCSVLDSGHFCHR